MTYSTIIGLLLIGISLAMYSFLGLDYSRFFSDKEFLIGITGGAGIGMIIGGFLGWLYKYKAINRQNARIVEEQKIREAEMKAQHAIDVEKQQLEKQQLENQDEQINQPLN